MYYISRAIVLLKLVFYVMMKMVVLLWRIFATYFWLNGNNVCDFDTRSSETSLPIGKNSSFCGDYRLPTSVRV